MSPSSRYPIGCWHHHPERLDTLLNESIRRRQPPGVLIIWPSRTKRHQRTPESDCEPSDRGSPGLWPSAGATRKALTSEGGPRAGLSLRCIKSKANFAAGLLNLSPEHRDRVSARHRLRLVAHRLRHLLGGPGRLPTDSRRSRIPAVSVTGLSIMTGVLGLATRGRQRKGAIKQILYWQL